MQAKFKAGMHIKFDVPKGELNMETRQNIHSITIEVKYTDADIDEILCTAFEGGINGWCGRVEVVGDYLGDYASEQISRGGELILHDIETDDPFLLTKAKFINGMEKYINNPIGLCDLFDEDGMLDVGMVDAAVADSIVQYALFDEIVYG